MYFCIVSGPAREHADAPHALALLRARRKRPRRRAAYKRDEFTPFHCPVPPGASERIAPPLLRRETGCTAGFRAANVRYGCAP